MAVESTRLATDNIGNEEAMCLRVTIGDTIIQEEELCWEWNWMQTENEVFHFGNIAFLKASEPFGSLK